MKLRSCVVLLCVSAVLANTQWLKIKTAQGPVRGHIHHSGELYAFYNIPYATAPTGVNKFKAPLPPPKWTRPYDAIEMNFVCPQNYNIIKDLVPERLVMNENCLIANVFVPRTSAKNLSVLVYVHGGGFSIGYGNRNKGTQLLKKKDFIMVTFNYRLGAHGFLCLGTKDIPGNAGMKDQVALLRWVKKNIAYFGGNPHDVTLAGASSGSASVDLIMLSKSAAGLFHRAIPESGGNLAAFAVQRDPLQIAAYYARKLNFTNYQDIFALENFYKTASIKLLTSVILFDRMDSTFLFSPCVESSSRRKEAFLTESPLSILKKGNYKKLPVLYGFTSMEGMLRIDYFDSWKDRMYQKFSDFLPADLQFQSEEEREEIAKTVKKFYFKEKLIGNNVLGFVDFFSDVIVTYPMLRAVQLHVKAGHKHVYLYEYSFLSENLVPYTDIKSTDHCDQAKAWLDNVDGTSESYGNRNYQHMRKIVREIWHNFIKTGKPVLPGSSLPKWPPVGPDATPHMSLGLKVELRGPLLDKMTHFWNPIYQLYHRDSVPPLALINRDPNLQNIRY